MAIFIGNTLLKLDSVDSTNNYAQKLLATTTVFDGTVITAAQQLMGKGQRGNVWYSEPNKNLCFSIILKGNYLTAQNQFYLNMAVAIGIVSYLQQNVDSTNKVKIKWPNDILLNTQKISGILIENSLAGSTISNTVIGIGLNVNQIKFSLEDFGRQPTSMRICEQKQFDLDACLLELLNHIEKYIFYVKNNQLEELSSIYHKYLYKLYILETYLVNQIQLEAIILGVSNTGKLILLVETGEQLELGIKEVKFLS